MPFTILQATPTDLPAIIAIYDAAFKNDRIIGNLMSAVPPEIKQAYDLEWYRREFNMAELTGCKFFKAVDDERGEMVGYAKWQYPHALTREQSKEKRRLDDAKEEDLPLPEGTNRGLYREFFGPLREKQRRYVDTEKDYYLHILAIHPSQQRTGIGSLLIRRGLQDADNANAKTYIEASPAGLPLYVRFGWREIDKIVVDVGKIDGGGVATEVCLMRERQGRDGGS